MQEYKVSLRYVFAISGKSPTVPERSWRHRSLQRLKTFHFGENYIYFQNEINWHLKCVSSIFWERKNAYIGQIFFLPFFFRWAGTNMFFSSGILRLLSSIDSIAIHSHNRNVAFVQIGGLLHKITYHRKMWQKKVSSRKKDEVWNTTNGYNKTKKIDSLTNMAFWNKPSQSQQCDKTQRTTGIFRDEK